MYELKSTFEHYYAEGSHGGECAVFAENLIIPSTPNHLLGLHLQEKLDTVKNYGIPIAQLDRFMVGDIVVFNFRPDGHIAIINNEQLCLTESNFHLDHIVHHTRIMAMNDPHVVGVIRGILKVNYIQMPIKLRVKLVANNAQWASMAAKIADIKSRLMAASQNRLDCDIDVDYTSLPDPPLKQVGNAKIIDDAWYDTNVTPHGTGYDFVFYLLTGTDPLFLGGNRGYAVDRDHGVIECEGLSMGENEVTSSPTVPEMSFFVNIFLHEVFGHGLRILTGQPDLKADGTFLVHDYLFSGPNSKFNLTGLLNLLDYSKLTSQGASMVIVQFDDSGTEYVLADDLTLIGYASQAALDKTLKGRVKELRTFPAAQRALFTIADSAIN